MTTEEFQKIVLEELRELRVGQEELRKEQKELRVAKMKSGKNKRIKSRPERIEKDSSVVIEQTADLTEFRHEVVDGLEEINSVISRLEIATAENWSDIAKLKAVRRMY